jgi:hypothetical protein
MIVDLRRLIAQTRYCDKLSQSRITQYQEDAVNTDAIGVRKCLILVESDE